MKAPRSVALCGLLVVAVDQVTKMLAWLPWVSDKLGFVHPLANHGLTLQVANAGRWTEVGLMTAVWICATALLLRLHGRGSVGSWGMGLILGGALGNIIDRALFGSVRDFLVLGPIVVNVADIAVLVGIAALYVRAATKTHEPRPEAASTAAP